MGQMCLTDADGPARFTFVDALAGGVTYGGGGLSGTTRGVRCLFSDTIEIVWLLRSAVTR